MTSSPGDGIGRHNGLPFFLDKCVYIYYNIDVEKLCITCKENPCDKGRRYCHRCYLERRKTQYYAKGGSEGKRYYGIGKCVLCNKEIKLFRKEQKYCWDCSVKVSKLGNKPNNYENGKGNGYCWYHRRLAEETIGRKLKTNEVVHHLDDNPKNNVLTNLIILSREKHGKLHFYLKEQRALLEKSNNVNGENCWNTLIVPMTTTWLETTSVKVIKLWEIGQSASEPLSQ